MSGKKDLSFRREILRKMIHISTLSVCAAYYYTDRKTTLTILIPLTVAFFIAEILVYKVKELRKLYLLVFGKLLRAHEVKTDATITGASWILIAMTLAVLIFPEIIAVNAIAIVVLGDLTAALVGKKFGRTEFLGKTLEGSLGFLVAACATVAAAAWIYDAKPSYLIVGFFAACAGAIAELLADKFRIDDNLAIPAAAGAVFVLGKIVSEHFFGMGFL